MKSHSVLIGKPEALPIPREQGGKTAFGLRSVPIGKSDALPIPQERGRPDFVFVWEIVKLPTTTGISHKNKDLSYSFSYVILFSDQKYNAYVNTDSFIITPAFASQQNNQGGFRIFNLFF